MLVEHLWAPLNAKATDPAAFHKKPERCLTMRVSTFKWTGIGIDIFGPDCTQSKNVVAIAQLLLSVPFSTAK